MNRTGKMFLFCAAAFFFLLAGAGRNESFAAAKTISSVTVTCTSNLTSGDILSEKEVDISGENQGDINICQSVACCYIDSYKLTGSGSRFVAAGDQIKVKIVIYTEDDSENAFLGTYSSKNVKINGGKFVSCSNNRSSLTVNFTMNPVRGTLPAPDNATWKGTSGAAADPSLGPGASASSSKKIKFSGTAVWDAPDGGTGYYDVWLYRGSTVVKKVEKHKGTNYNFFPYMTKEGTYSFKVRTVPSTDEQKKYATRSEFVESDQFYLDAEHVSDGSGQEKTPQSSEAVGWVKSGSTWYYKYPDGSFKKNGWEMVSGKWYLFDGSGRMLTGFQTIASGTYCLAGSGEMLEGWIKKDGYWYFFNNTPGDTLEGAMQKNTWIREPDGKAYYVGSDGIMCTGWKQIGDQWFHFDASGNLSRNTVIDTFYVNQDGVWIP